MIKNLKLAFLFLVACGLFSGLYGFYPPADAGGSDTDPVATPTGRDTDSRLRAAHAHPPTDAGGSDSNPVASTTPRGLPARGPRSALGTDTDPVAKLRTLTQPLPEGEELGFTDSEFAAHIEQLKKKLPSEDFTIVVQKPFVVIGDEPADAVKEHSIRTVKWAVDKLKQEYFSKDPNEIIDIWL